MPDQFQSLVQAILTDDRAQVQALLKQNPSLATATAPKAHLEMGVMHWIYADDTALHVAAAGHRVELVRILLAAGAEVGAAMNHRRSQPLHYAADGCLESPDWDARRQVATIELLLKAGADIHAQDKNGATPLHRAVRTRCAAAAKVLFEAGADARLRNKPGSTPFHLAVQNTGRGGSGAEQARAAQREIIGMFRDSGLKPTLKDARGKTVLDWVRNDEIRAMLAGHAT